MVWLSTKETEKVCRDSHNTMAFRSLEVLVSPQVARQKKKEKHLAEVLLAIVNILLKNKGLDTVFWRACGSQ
jgi:hypothetical protein